MSNSVRRLRRQVARLRDELRAAESAAERTLPSRWVPLADNRQQQLAYASQADHLFFGGMAGGGKAGRCPDRNSPNYNSANETKVFTPKGFVLLGDVRVGDQVCNPDGTVAQVIGVFPQGVKQFYRVTMADGASVEACGEHLWAASIAGQRKRMKLDPPSVPEGLRPEDEWNLRVMQRCRMMTTEKIAELVGRATDRLGEGERPYHVLLPLTAPVNMTGPPGRWPHMPPYTLGALIGDGYLSPTQVSITTADEEIADNIRRELGDRLRVVRMENHPSCPAYRIAGELGQKTDSPQQLLRRDGLLGKHSWDKFVPLWVMRAPVDVRWSFVRGLMDTDGHIGEGGDVEYTTVSEQLAKDVQYLLRSLGYKATLNTKETTYEYKGEKLNGRLAYRLHIRGADNGKLFALKRKVERAKPYNGGDVWPSHRVVSVAPTVRDHARCIAVDNPNHLYITDDFIVTHNTALLIGLALTAHRKSLLLRKEATQLTEAKDFLQTCLRPKDRFAQVGHGARVVTADGRKVELAGVESPAAAQKYKGRAHDLKGWDEASDFIEDVFRFVNGWCRTTIPGQRTRVVAASNPPTTVEGEWVVRYWGPWLDPQSPVKLAPGELGWFVRDPETDTDRIVDGPEPVTIAGKTIRPHSRTFIPGVMVSALEQSGYRAALQSMPEELRAAYLEGNFTAKQKDHQFQLIPTAHVLAAVDRGRKQDWRRKPGHRGYPHPPLSPLTALGVDPAGGGADDCSLAPAYGRDVGPLWSYRGKETADGMLLAAKILSASESNPECVVRIDTTGGYGQEAANILTAGGGPGRRVDRVSFGTKTTFRDRSGKLQFQDVRSAMWWYLRELLDPNGKSDSELITLPDDPRLVADLCAPRWRLMHGSVVQVEPKVSRQGVESATGGQWGIKQRLGRSPDRGDAVALALWKGEQAVFFAAGYSTPKK